MKSGIYEIANKIDHKVYVGSSKRLKDRRYEHWYLLKRGKHTNPHLQYAWNKFGESSFEFTILEYCDPTSLEGREDWWIELLNSRNPNKGYNLLSADRKEVSEQTKLKMSLAQKGKPKAPRTEEHKTNLYAAVKIALQSKEVKDKMSAAKKGKKQTPEAIENRMSSRKGYRHSEETKAKLRLSCALRSKNVNL